MTIELYPHQEKAVLEMHNGCILWGDVGTGKSLTAVAYYMRNYNDLDIYVITTAKKRDSLDWEGDAAKFGIGKNPDSTLAGVLTVDSWNNLEKYVDVRGAFFIFDEQRIVGSGSWVKSFLKIARQNQWILLSATPGDTWLDYIPVFLANGFYKNRTEFLNEHVIFSRWSKFPKVDRYIGVGRLVKYRNSLLVHMPYDRHTERIVQKVKVDYDKDLFEKVLDQRWHVFEKRPLRDVAELFLVMRKVVNSDSSRIRAIRELMEDHPRLIVFYNHNYELEALRTLAETASKESSGSTSSSRRSSKENSTMRSPEPSNSLRTTKENDKWQTQIHANTESSNSPSLMKKSSTGSESVSAATLPSARSGSPKTTGSTTSTTTSGSGQDVATAMTSRDGTSLSTKSTAPMKEASSFGLAEWNGHKHQPVPETDRWVYLVQYQAGSEGWNCITANAMVFYSLTYSYKNWHQAFGRIDRLNTPFTKLHYYIFMSDSLIDKAIWRSLSGKKNFNESRFLRRFLDNTSH